MRRRARPTLPKEAAAKGLACLVAAGLAISSAAVAFPKPPPRIVGTAIGGRISGNLRLAGQVRVTADLLVLPGAALVLAPGTVLTFDKSESSKVDPEYFFGGMELIVRGRLRAEGAEFRFPERSGGIVVDGGEAELSDCRILGAEAGLSLLGGGTVRAAGPIRVRHCRVGLALFPSHRGGIEGAGPVALEENAVGVVRFPGAPRIPRSVRAERSEEADLIAWDDGGPLPKAAREEPLPPSPGALRIGDTFLDRDRTLSGDVVVDGIVRVAPDATLTILPGTRVFFTFRDTDGDGIGENGLFLQGTLVARGTADRPIRFLPDGAAGRGRWDSVNFMASDRGDNILENVEIAGAYRGLHAHFSRLKGRAIRITDCYRGLQFQESGVDLDDVEVSGANSALRCRDSDVRLANFRARETASGGNFLRSAVALSAPDVATSWYGLRFRESRVEVRGGAARQGLVGISVQEGTVRLEGVLSEAAGLAGFALQEGDVTMTRCRAVGSRLDAASVTRARVEVRGGVLGSYGRHAVRLGGPAEVFLRGVDLGAARTGNIPILDGKVSPGLGIVTVE